MNALNNRAVDAAGDRQVPTEEMLVVCGVFDVLHVLPEERAT